MAFATHPDINEVLNQEGYLFWNPSGLANESEWGTKLGFVMDGIRWSPNYNVVVLGEEEFGEEQRKKVYTGDSPQLFALLMNYNATALSVLFPGFHDGTAVKSPGTIPIGKDISLLEGDHLLFVPKDTKNNNVFLAQKAVPSIQETADIIFSHKDKTTFPIVFDLFRKTTSVDGKYYCGPLSGAVLR